MAFFSITGVEQTAQKLKELGKRAERRVAAPVLKEQADMLIERMRANCPYSPGALKDSLGRTNPKRARRGTKEMYVVVGPRRRWPGRGTHSKITPTKYAHLVEYGTHAHGIRATRSVFALIGKVARGKQVVRTHPGTAPRPFMRSSFDSTRDTMRKNIGEGLAKGVLAEAKKV